MPEFNPFGQLLESRMASDQFNERKRQNALQESYRQKQETRAQGTYDAQQQDRSLGYAKAIGPIASQLSKLTPEQRAQSWPNVFATVSRFMPEAIEGLTPEYSQQIENQIMGLGQWHDSMQPQADPAAGLTGDAKNFYTINKRMPTTQELADFKKASKPDTSVTVNTGKVGQMGLKPFLDNMPKLHENATTEASAVARFDNVLSILDKQGDEVTGFAGGLKRAVAPYATALGLNTEAMDDAQILKVLFDTGAGSMRMEVVGPGPVSEFEQKILQSVSGGTISAAEGAKRLIKYNRDRKIKGINTFNARMKNASEIEGLDFLPQLYPEISVDAPALTTGQERTIVRSGKQGDRRVVEYSDGSIEYAD